MNHMYYVNCGAKVYLSHISGICIMSVALWIIVLSHHTFSQLRCYSTNLLLCNITQKKKLAPSSILHEAKIAYYARNIFEAGRFFCFS